MNCSLMLSFSAGPSLSQGPYLCYFVQVQVGDFVEFESRIVYTTSYPKAEIQVRVSDSSPIS